MTPDNVSQVQRHLACWEQKKKQDCIWTGHTPSLNSVPMIILTGRAETPRVIEISTSKRSPPIRIENATQSGLKHPCYTDDSMLNQSKEHHYHDMITKMIQ